MSYNEPSFWKYLTYDKYGMLKGISDDAPEEEKKLFEKYMEDELEDEFKI